MDLSNSYFPNYLGEITYMILSQALKNAQEELDLFAETTPLEELGLSQLCEEMEKCEEINIVATDLKMSVQDVWDALQYAIELTDVNGVSPCLLIGNNTNKSK